MCGMKLDREPTPVLVNKTRQSTCLDADPWPSKAFSFEYNLWHGFSIRHLDASQTMPGHLPKGRWAKLNRFWISLSCALHYFPAGSVFFSPIVCPQLSHGQMPHCMVWKPVCWAVALPTPYFICFEHKTTATPPHTVLQAMDQASEVIIRLVHLQIDCLFYQSQAATSKQQTMEQSTEPGEQTVRLQAAGLERSLATLAASCVWCKTQSRLTPDLTQHLQAAEHRAGWKCQLRSALAQRCLQSVSWAGLQCSGQTATDCRKQGSWGSKELLAPQFKELLKTLLRLSECFLLSMPKQFGFSAVSKKCQVICIFSLCREQEHMLAQYFI